MRHNPNASFLPTCRAAATTAGAKPSPWATASALLSPAAPHIRRYVGRRLATSNSTDAFTKPGAVDASSCVTRHREGASQSHREGQAQQVGAGGNAAGAL